MFLQLLHQKLVAMSVEPAHELAEIIYDAMEVVNNPCLLKPSVPVQSPEKMAEKSGVQETVDLKNTMQKMLERLDSMDKRLNNIDIKMNKLDIIEKKLESVTTRTANLEKQIAGLESNLQTEVDTRKKDIKKLGKKFDDMKEAVNDILSEPTKETIVEDLQNIKTESETNKELMLDIQSRSMRDNLVFSGIPVPESVKSGRVPYEDTEAVLKNFIETTLGIPDNIEFERVHRAGQPRQAGAPRIIIAKFSHFKDRERVRRAAPTTLKGTEYGINEQFPKEIEDRRKKLYPVMRQARRQSKKAVLVKDKLYIDNELYVAEPSNPVSEAGESWRVVHGR